MKDDLPEWYMVGKQDTSLFKKRDDAEMCRHLDACGCGGISASKAEDGMVVFRLPKMEVGLVVVCGCCGKLDKFDAVSVSKQNANKKLPIHLLWESSDRAVLDRESIEYTESVFRLLRAYQH
jgi:hypothetical protein